MPSFPGWMQKAASEPTPGSAFPATSYIPRPRDPNAPDHRLQITSKSIYERALPGGSYITAHCERLQSGYYDSPVIHEDCVTNVRFMAIRFVFHEASTERRFKSAIIRLSVHDDNLKPDGFPLPPQIPHPADDAPPPPHSTRRKPAFMRHAPHLLYGAMSPETLDWNFNLAGSLGVAQTPVSASINPSGGFKTSYKVYKMMKIQGSIRTNSSWYGKHYDVEDGELVWTLEENELQKSGLPREFTFVVMLTKGDDANDVRFEISIDPEVASWFGSYPTWWTHFLKYQPLNKEPLNLDIDIGQKFEPCDSRVGFNFASLMSTFNDFVTLPGTLYSTNDWSSNPTQSNTNKQGGDQSKQKQQGQQRSITQSPSQMSQGNQDSQDQPTSSNTVHLRIHLDQGQKQGQTLSTSYPYPEPVSTPGPANPSASSRTRRSSQAAVTPSSTNTKVEGSSKPTSSRSDKLTRRITLNSGLMSTPPKYKTSRVTPLQTHYEEQPTAVRIKSLSDSDTDQDYVPSFPESLPTPPRLPLLGIPPSSGSRHRHSKSLSTTSSAEAAAAENRRPSNSSPGPGVNAANAPMSSVPSLRRSRSRSGLRRASLHSEPEDEEAIAAAMDMLSGSPPPPAPIPPKSAPATVMIPSDDIVLATPRTRAILADLLEVEEAENARVQRRNGNLNTEMSRQAGDLNPGRQYQSNNVTIRSREREKNREKRYSMPVTSTGIGYPGTGGTFNARAHEGGIRSDNVSTGNRTNDESKPVSGGRSSLMIPVGPKRDSGLGIGVANNIADANAQPSGGGGSRLISRKRDVSSAYEGQ